MILIFKSHIFTFKTNSLHQIINLFIHKTLNVQCKLIKLTPLFDFHCGLFETN